MGFVLSLIKGLSEGYQGDQSRAQPEARPLSSNAPAARSSHDGFEARSGRAHQPEALISEQHRSSSVVARIGCRSSNMFFLYRRIADRTIGGEIFGAARTTTFYANHAPSFADVLRSTTAMLLHSRSNDQIAVEVVDANRNAPA
jgi:hypothetical protein